MDIEPTQTNGHKKELIAGLAVLIVIVAIVAAVTISAHKGKTDAMTTSTANSTSNTASSSDTTSTATYKDGTYAATGSYESPGGNESIKVSVTLSNGVVTDATATSGANDPEAKEYQNDFISGYKSLVVGKKISSIKLNRVSGSSLTSQGFNEAIKSIEQQATAA